MGSHRVVANLGANLAPEQQLPRHARFMRGAQECSHSFFRCRLVRLPTLHQSNCKVQRAPCMTRMTAGTYHSLHVGAPLRQTPAAYDRGYSTCQLSRCVPLL